MKLNHFLSQLGRFAKMLHEGGFLAPESRLEKRKLKNVVRRRRISSQSLFLDSIRCMSGRAYLVAKRAREEVLVCVESSNCTRPPLSLFKTAPKHVFHVGQEPIVVYFSRFTSRNLRKLMEEELPEAGPRNLGSTPRLGLGVRMLFTLPFLLKALRQIRIVADFQLSAGREFSLTEVVKAAPGRHPEWLGHTGLDAQALYDTIAKECFKSDLPLYGTEIDHLIVTGRPDEAISRIRGSSAVGPGSKSRTGLQESIEYNRRIIDEATSTGFVRGMTVDTSSLLREEFDDQSKWMGQILREMFDRQFSEEERRALMNRYHPGQPFRFQTHNGSEEVCLSFSEEDVMRLALKFKPSLAINKELFNYMSKALKGRTFAFEPSLDEAPNLTKPKELLFYLTESEQMGMPAQLVAPNVGFRKRENYEGDLNELRERVRELHTIASNFGVILDFHSGSDKSTQVYRAVSEACQGRLKLKMSGVYQLLYFDTLASFPRGTKERKLFERIWRYTLGYATQKASEGDATAKRQVETIRLKMVGTRKRRTEYKANPKDDFFRYYSFIAVATKKRNGKYIFRNTLYRLARTRRVSERYAPKVVRLTVAVARALGLEGGLRRLLPNQGLS